MGKVFNMMMLGVVVTTVLLIFNGGGQTPTSLFLLLLNPSGWEYSAFYLLMFSVATASGAVIIGLAAIIRQDWLLRAGIVVSLNSIVIGPFIDLFQFVHAQTNFIGTGYTCVTSPLCDYISTGGIGQIFALIFVSPLILYVLWSCIEYIWKGDSF